MDYKPKQLRHERKGYQQRIDIAKGLQKKLSNLFRSSEPNILTLTNQEHMLLAMLLGADVHTQGRVAEWINGRLAEITKQDK
jgi:hypothetical protein